MSSSGRSRRSQIDSSSVASSDGFAEDNLSIDVERDEVKRKSRNLSEKKRRDQFNMLINELCSMVNLDPNEEIGSSGNKKMDKSSVLRATITFLKNHNEEAATNTSSELGEENCQPDNSANHSFISSWKPSFLSTEEFSHLSLEALDAFILIFDADNDGKIIYASESVFPLLGISSSYLSNTPSTTATTSSSSCTTITSRGIIGSNNENESNNIDGTSVYDIIHESEKSALRKLVMEAVNCGKVDEFFSMMIHFRHHSTNLNQTEKSAECFYELVRLVGAYRRIDDYMGFGSAKNCFLAICRLQTPKLIKELHILAPLSHDFGTMKNNEFISRHSLEWKFLFLDHRAPMIIGYLPFEVLGTSGYDYYHWDDLDLVVAGHQRLMQIGSGESCYYRFLTKGQQWIWLRTKYFITYHMWNSKPEFVVCTHTVIDRDERSLDNVKEDSNRQNNERGKITQHHYHHEMNSSRANTSNDFQVKSKSTHWTVAEFNDHENTNEQTIYNSDKIAVTYPSNDSNGSTPYSISTVNMMTGVEDCLSLPSSSPADYVLNNSIYDPSAYLMNQTPVSPTNQQQANLLTDQQKQPQGHHASHQHLQKPCQPPQPLPPSSQHVPASVSQSNSVLSSHQHSQSTCHQQQQLHEQSHQQHQPPSLPPPPPPPPPSAPQQQSFGSSAALATTGPMVSNSVKQIKEQQEELRRVSEQLMMVQVVGNDSTNSTQQQQQTSASASDQHEIESISEFTQLQTLSTGTKLQNVQPDLMAESMTRGENDLNNAGAIYTDISCSDHTLIARDFPPNLQSVDCLYPQDK
ncbi:circadian locomoter output cycles protein kaput-like isoform X2 [Panonychus citri]|uniref:circadian locomoter output cycles protein kaput-like isoform X2 n=1 Tax=Panonychus citri TaxID=50023 RepID=UPI0023075D18|nr:circadian locomoter output cycles protein kaput-like isoform X2 [Panonychus citri]